MYHILLSVLLIRLFRRLDYLGVLDTDQISRSPVQVITFILDNNCHFWGEMFGIFADAFLQMNRQSFLFNNAFRVEQVKSALYFFYMTCDW